MSEGSPCRRKTWRTSNSAVSLAEGNLGKGMKWAALEKRSTTVQMQPLPSDSGSPVTKSIAIWDQGRCGTGSGLKRPAGDLLTVLFLEQLSQAATKAWMSSLMDGHQKRCPISAWVWVAPGWQAILELCPHSNTWGRTEEGTKRRLGAHYLVRAPDSEPPGRWPQSPTGLLPQGIVGGE